NILNQLRRHLYIQPKGITGSGQGFDLLGRRLGGFSRQTPLSSPGKSALAAAENRSKRGILLPLGPRLIGGDNNIKTALNPLQVAAIAVERRLHDDLWCGSKSPGSDTGVEGNLVSSIGSFEGSTSSTVAESGSIPPSHLQSMSSQENVDLDANWKCSTCTLMNKVSLYLYSLG
ncbi:hypothetical protein CFOL_v3_03274, partial [Cephalotus follicularis]